MKRRFENGKDFIEFEVQEKIEKIVGIPEEYKKYFFRLTYCIKGEIHHVSFERNKLKPTVDMILKDVRKFNLTEVE